MVSRFASPAVLDAEKARVSRPAGRTVLQRTRGAGHGPIVRLMSPSDLGEVLKPFVFLDLFDLDGRLAGAMPIHPHSGIATVTVVAEGDFRFEDAGSGKGVIGYGGVEWMRAGSGVWHGQEMSPGTSPRLRGFQLWVALGPELENDAPDSQYVQADRIPEVGPAKLILGRVGEVASPVRSPEGVNYLLVTLPAGARWIYASPPGHTAAFVAVSRGKLVLPGEIAEGELAALAPSSDPIILEAGPDAPATLVLGSAVPHRHDLVLGRHSVHTTPAALGTGERRIAELHHEMSAAGFRRQASGATPVFR